MKVGILHTAFIGDIVLLGLLIEALYTDKHEIYLIIKKESLLLYNNDYRIKKCIAIDKKSGFKKIKSIFLISQQIKSLSLDVILVPHKSVTTALCVLFAKVPKSIGFNDSALKFVYRELMPFNKSKHECLRCLDLAPRWLLSEASYQIALKISRPILIPNKSLSIFNEKNPDFFSKESFYFIVNPGSAWATKKYPALNFAKAIFLILSNSQNLTCILAGSRNDYNDIKCILDYFDAYPHLKNKIIDVSKYLPLDEFVTLVSKASFVIANDSSPVHIASASNVPVVVIFGPTSWTFGFYPTSEKSTILVYRDAAGNTLSCHPCTNHGSSVCPEKHFKCMRELSPEIILDSVQKMLPHFF
ncbi:glycosyltransferase family 9 protein [Spirobacillus cienkowskii]|uniref:glycosyltransferase family 9 protein n=1 Tax=Spirobacillus cienkowskii TaxID=495820 RepID=UPI0030D06101